MNLLKGVIQEIYVKEGTTMARVSVKGAQIRVPLFFLPEAGVGDEVLVDSGVAISRVEPQKVEEL
jgi:hydrogenase maturation factor